MRLMSMPRSLERFSVVVDTNEWHVGNTWFFPGYSVSKVNLLEYGCDYSVKGQIGQIGVERKSYNDYVRCVGADWKRFQKQLFKLRKNPHHVVVVEGNINDRINERSRMVHTAIVNQTARIVAANIPVVFTADRDKAVTFCIRFMSAALKRIQDGKTVPRLITPR